MPPEVPPATWSAAQRRLHWLVAAGVVAAFALSLVMTRLSDDQLLLKFFLYQLHKTLGLLVLAGTLARFVLLIRHGRPPLPGSFTRLEKCAAYLGHGVLYVLLIVVPVLGYLTNSTSPSRIPVLFMLVIPLPNLTPPSQYWNDLLVTCHHFAAIALVVIAGVHALIAIVHQLRGQPILRRMWSG